MAGDVAGTKEVAVKRAAVGALLLAPSIALSLWLAAPGILSFTAIPARINRGQPVVLKWATENATSVSIQPEIGDVPLSGERRVFPRRSTTYTLKARNAGEEATAMTGVTVNQPEDDARPPAKKSAPPPAPPPPAESRPPTAGETPPSAGTAAPVGPRVAGRDTLLPDTLEETGYGLYSYVLFGRPAAGDSPRYARYRAVAQSFLAISTVSSVLRYTPRANINLTYIPLKEDPGTGSSAERLIEVYDFDRAKALLTRTGSRLNDGPYLVSTAVPLGAVAKADADHMIFQDLSTVPSKVAALWMKSFLEQASQGRFWEPDKRANFILNVRTAIAAGGEEVGTWGNALATIVWFRR